MFWFMTLSSAHSLKEPHMWQWPGYWSVKSLISRPWPTKHVKCSDCRSPFPPPLTPYPWPHIPEQKAHQIVQNPGANDTVLRIHWGVRRQISNALRVSVPTLSYVWLFTAPWATVCQPPLSIGSSRQKYLSALPFLPPGNVPDPGLKPMSPESPELAGRFFTTEPREKPAYRIPIIKRSFCKWLSRYMLENTCLCKLKKKIKQTLYK